MKTIRARDVEGAGAARKLFGLSIAARHQQEGAARDQRPCFDEKSQALAREAVADESDDAGAGRDDELLAERGARGRIRRRPEAIEIDAVVNRHGFFRRESEFANQIVANEI